MNTHIFSRFFLILAVLVLYVPGNAVGADERSHRALVVTSYFKGGPARLIITRIATLGKFVNVSLWIDGNPAGGIPYGGTYNGFLSPGRHTITTLGVPVPAWPPPARRTLDVQSGHTYVFMAMGDNDGHVVLVSRPD